MTKNPIALTRNVDGRRYASPELIEEYEHMAPILGAVGLSGNWRKSTTLAPS